MSALSPLGRLRPNIVALDNYSHKELEGPAAFLDTFAAVGKSISGVSEARAETAAMF